MGVSGGPKSNVDGLIFHLDPANKRSYPGTGTTIYDLSGNNYTSYFANGALLADDVVRVDGADDYIATPIFNLTAPITVTAWVKNVVNEGIVFGSYNGGVYANAEYIFEYVGKTIIIQGIGGGKTFQLPQLNFNQWSYLAMTRDSSNNMSVFLNGVASSSNPQSYSNNLNFNQIGRYSNFSNQYNVKGSIGEVKIYSRALSSTEILQNYNVSKTRYNVVENIITDGLVFNFDAANPSSYAGTGISINNIAGVGSTGILINGPTFSQLNGGSLVFDGTNDYAQMATDVLDLGTSNFTVDVWFKTNASQTQTLIANQVSNGWNGFNFGINSSGYLTPTVDWGNSQQYGALQSSSAYKNNSWTEATFVMNGSTVSNWVLYINGTQVSAPLESGSVSSLSGSGISNAVALTIGTRAFGSYFSGQISSAKIYNRALSSTEVLQNYNATKNRYINVLPPISDALVLNLDAGSRASYVGTGTSWYDLSNSRFNSTLVGSPTFAGTGSSGYFVFDSNTKSATFNTSLLSGYSAGTIECSVYISNLSSSFILARQRNGVNTFSVLSVGNYTDAGGQLATGTAGIVYYHNKNAQTVLSSSTALQVNTWYRLAITFTTSSVILYINGVQDATVLGDYSVPSDTSTDPRVGAWIKDGTNYPMNGRLAQVQIYNRALTAAEVLQNFNFYRTRYGI